MIGNEADRPPMIGDATTGRLRQGSAVVLGARVQYWATTNGGSATGDTLLLLHGLGGDHDGILEMALQVPGARVIAPDLPGFGVSDQLAGEHSLDSYAEAVEELRQALGLTRFHLVGHSLGASIGLVYAARYPAALAGLYLLNPVSTADNVTANLGKAYYRIAGWLPAGLARWWLTSRPAVYLTDAAVITTRDRARRRRILEQDYRNYRRARPRAIVESFLSYYRTPLRDHARRVGTPTLLVTGDRDFIAPPAEVKRLHADIAGSHVLVVPGAGHLVPMEEPAQIAGLIAEHLATLRL